MTMTIRDINQQLTDNGWVLVAKNGICRQYRHPQKPRRITIAGNPSQTLAPGALASIYRQAGLKGQSN